MTQAKGFKGSLAIDFETTFGQSPDTKAAKVVPFNTNAIVGKQNVIQPATITGGRSPVQPELGRATFDGQIQVPLCYRSIGFWLKGMFGIPTTTTDGTKYTHVFKVNDNGQPSMVIEKTFQDIGKHFVYNGCKTSVLKLPWGNDGELVASMDIMGAAETCQDTAYDAAATTVALDRISNPMATIKEGGVAIATVVSGELTVNAGLDGSQYTVGSGNARSNIPEGIMNVSGTLKTLFTDTGLIDKGAQGTESSLELKFSNTAKSLTFLFPEIKYERTSPTISGPAGVQVDLNWRAYYANSAEGSAVVVTLVNDVASYV